MTDSEPDGRLRLASPLTALLLGGLVLALLAATLPVAVANHIFTVNDVPNLVLIVATVAVGVVVARHQPFNPMGWLLLGTGGFLMMSVVGTAWLTLDYRIHHGQLPFGWLALLVQPGWAPAIVCLGLTVLLFPDGHLPPGHWRWLVWCYLAAASVWIAGAWAISITAIATHHVQVDAGGELASLDRPGGSTAWWGTVQNGFLLLLGFSLLASIGRQVVAFIGSDGERRQQVKWP
jgi:hypothetical protein